MCLNIIDNLQEKFVIAFDQTIPTKDAFLSLIVALLGALIINYVYKKTYTGVSYSKTFSMSIVLLTMVTSIIIRTITSNLALSLGMVGALSIVRFRTAIKDAIDTVFMFWAISVGIMSGVGLYFITILATCIIGLVYFINYTYQAKKTNKHLLVIKTYSINADLLIGIMKKRSKVILKTETYKNNIAELTFELPDRRDADDVLKFKTSPGIISINLIDID